MKFTMYDLRFTAALQSALVSLVTRRLFSGQLPSRHARSRWNCPEALEVRCLPAATLMATLNGDQLSITDVDATGKDNQLEVSVVGTDLVITDANEQFISAPAGGTLSNGDQTLTIPLSLITAGLTINSAGGADAITIASLGTTMGGDLSIDGGSGVDSVTFQSGPITVGSGSIFVFSETIDVNAATTASGAINLTSTGDDSLLTINAPVEMGSDSTLIADKMAINATVTVTPGKLTLAPESTADDFDMIDIGADVDTAANTLQLSDAELDRITAGFITIGDDHTGTLTVSQLIEHAADDSFLVTAVRNMLFTSGSGWATHNGDLTFRANNPNRGNRSFVGIELDQATLTSSGSGDISLSAIAGTGGDGNIGILIHNGSRIESNGIGRVTVSGGGGLGLSENRGIEIGGADTVITSKVGGITITGSAGPGVGGEHNTGVWLHSGATVSSTGTAKITIFGTSNRGANENNGVLFNGYGHPGATSVTTVNGDIKITGSGNTIQTGSGNRGVGMYEGSVIQSTGAGKITIAGTAGAGSSSLRGVEIGNAGTRITSATGNIQITGKGGDAIESHGVWLFDGSVVESTGTALITIDGTGGSGSSDTRGVQLSEANTKVTSVNGAIHIIGHGGDGINDHNIGVWMVGGPTVSSTGTATIRIDGTGGTGASENSGVIFNGFGNGGATNVSSVNGDITIVGHGAAAGTGDHNRGIGMFAGAFIQSTGLAKITLDGTGGSGTNDNRGIELADVGTRLTSQLGAISLTGQGGSGSYGFGIWVRSGAVVQSTGSASITMMGIGGSGANDQSGVMVNGYNSHGLTRIESVDGDIQITGWGGDTSSQLNWGVGVLEGATIESTGLAKISLNGTGGASGLYNRGVEIAYAATRVTSQQGDISITGHGGDGAYGFGVWVAGGAAVESTGTATITLTGTGGNGGTDQLGVILNGYDGIGNTRVASLDGDIHLVGIGGISANGGHHGGIGMFQGAVIESTGTAKITLDGTGGSGIQDSRGVELADAGTRVTSAVGDVSITGQGGVGDFGIGVWVRSGAVVESTDTAQITIHGTGGATDGMDRSGVYLNGFGTNGATRVASVNGDISIIGSAGQSLNLAERGNTGVGLYEGAFIESTGTASIGIDGTGGSGNDEARGFEMGDVGTRIASVSGAIQITGHGGHSAGVLGMWIRSGAVIESTGTATISLDGTGGTGAQARGVEISDAGTRITSSVGDIEITGHGGATPHSFGVWVRSGAVVESTGTAKITITGTGGADGGSAFGVLLNGFGFVGATRVASVDGDVLITGLGGNSPLNSYNPGVGVYEGAVIESTGSAKLTINGTGGTGTDRNRGVEILSEGTLITSVTGDIQITGQGGSGTTTENNGVWLAAGASVASTGTARITIDGTAGSGTDENNGVILNGYGTVGATNVSTVDGDITIIGHGATSGTGSANRGIGLYAGPIIQSTGLGKITLNGTGGTGTHSARGIEVAYDGARITSAIGDIQLTGQGGPTESAYGIWIVDGGLVESTGTAKITFDGTGGANTDGSGVALNTGIVTSVDGDITLTGHGGQSADGSGMIGVWLLDDSTIKSTGTAQITLNGTGGTGRAGTSGVQLNGVATQVTTVDGAIHIIGQGGTGTGDENTGVALQSGPTVASSGSGTITIEGTGGTGANENNGVSFNFTDSPDAPHVTAVDGDITIIGHGSNTATGRGSRGIGMYSGAVIQSTGLAKITLDGTGGTATDSSRGVVMAFANTLITSVTGDIQITGRGGANPSSYGVWVLDGAAVESTGSAKITLLGTGGDGTDGSGVAVNTGSVTSVDGDITLTGQGGATADGELMHGVYLLDGAKVESTGNAKIVIDGTGGSGSQFNRGVEITDVGTQVISQLGDISITGQGGTGTAATETYGVGVWIHDSAIVSSTATAGVPAKITIDGTGGNGTYAEIGVWITLSGRVASTLGDIVITGQGGTGTGPYNYGVNLQTGATIESTGTATISVHGAGGTGSDTSRGVLLEQNTAIRSADGSIDITGIGGSGGVSNAGVMLVSGGVIESTGIANIHLEGTGGPGTEANYGVLIYGTDSWIRSAGGDINIVGQGGAGTTVDNAGVALIAGGTVTATGTGEISVTGTGGAGVYDGNFRIGQAGVWLLHPGSAITSTDGNIQVIGTGGSGDIGSDANHGVMVQGGAIQTSPGGTGNVHVTGTAGNGANSVGIFVEDDADTAGIDTSAGLGNITLVTDSLNIDTVDHPGRVDAGAQTVAIHPQTPGTAIDLGAADSDGTLGLTDAELDRVFAGNLIIGDTASGDLTVSADITRTALTNMRLTTGANLLISGGAVDTVAGFLVLDSGDAPDVIQPSHAGLDATASELSLAGDLSIAINGSAVDTGYSQLHVAGIVNLDGVNLTLSGSYIPSSGESFVIVDSFGVTGKFNGLNEGDTFDFNGRTLRISYAGGPDQHDVILTSGNLAPVADDGTLSVTEDLPGNGTLTATDLESPSLTYSIVTPPAHGTAVITDATTGAYTYTPDLDYNGPDSFTFKANDGESDSNTATISITVDAVNDAPQLNLNGGPVTFSAKAAKKGGPIQIVPNVTVVDVDQTAGFGVGGGTLNLSIDVAGKVTKKGLKLYDAIGIPNASSIGTTAGPSFQNGKLSLTIALHANTTTANIESFLRGITFTTNGKGTKQPQRIFQAQLTDAAGAISNLLQQTINVTK